MVEKDKIMEKLQNVMDPETGFSVVDMGFIYDVDVDGSQVNIDMTLTTPGCPMHRMFTKKVEEEVKSVEGVENVDVELVFDPPWSPEMLSDEAREQLGLD